MPCGELWIGVANRAVADALDGDWEKEISEVRRECLDAMGWADDPGGGLRFESVMSANVECEELANPRETALLCLLKGDETVCPNGVSRSGLSQRASDAPSSHAAMACGGLLSSLHTGDASVCH